MAMSVAMVTDVRLLWYLLISLPMVSPTYLRLFLGLDGFVLRTGLESAGRIFVNPRFEEAVGQPFGAYFLPLDVNTHSWVDVKHGCIRPERLSFWNQPS